MAILTNKFWTEVERLLMNFHPVQISGGEGKK